MSRSWDDEWNELLRRERAAFGARNAAFGEVMPIFAGYGAPGMDLLVRLEASDIAWKQAKSACNAFIADYRRAG